MIFLAYLLFQFKNHVDLKFNVTRFWKNLDQVCSTPKDWKAK